MSLEITNSGGLFKIKNTVNGKIIACSKDDIRFKLRDELTIIKGATFPVMVINNASDVSTPSEANLTDLLVTLSSLT